MGIVFAILLIAAVTFSACLEDYSGYVEEETLDVEVIPISGIDQNITVSSGEPVRFVVSGMRNVITVSYGVKVIDIVMSGVIIRSIFLNRQMSTSNFVPSVR